jgi:hypothetical protein
LVTVWPGVIVKIRRPCSRERGRQRCGDGVGADVRDAVVVELAATVCRFRDDDLGVREAEQVAAAVVPAAGPPFGDEFRVV